MAIMVTATQVISSQDIGPLQVLVLERVDPSRNMHRYYVLSLETTLFGDTALRREWGRIGARRGRSRLDLQAEPAFAREALHDWFNRKVKRGYSAPV